MQQPFSITIASSAAPVKASLEALCAQLGIATAPNTPLWLVDGNHPPASIPKQVRVIVLGSIPNELTPERTIPTPARLEDIAEALRSQQAHTAPTALRKGWAFDTQQRALTHADHPAIALTEKEVALLQQLLQQAPAEISREHLLKEVWAYDTQVDTHTLETHIYRLRQKAGDDPFQIVTTEQGYKVAL